jgi:hypothetical protein
MVKEEGFGLNIVILSIDIPPLQFERIWKIGRGLYELDLWLGVLGSRTPPKRLTGRNVAYAAHHSLELV